MRAALEAAVGRKIKVAAILLTHWHYGDGTGAFLDEGTKIWGHEYLDRNRNISTSVAALPVLPGPWRSPVDGVRAREQQLLLRQAGLPAREAAGRVQLQDAHETLRDRPSSTPSSLARVQVTYQWLEHSDSVGFYVPRAPARDQLQVPGAVTTSTRCTAAIAIPDRLEDTPRLKGTMRGPARHPRPHRQDEPRCVPPAARHRPGPLPSPTLTNRPPITPRRKRVPATSTTWRLEDSDRSKPPPPRPQRPIGSFATTCTHPPPLERKEATHPVMMMGGPVAVRRPPRKPRRKVGWRTGAGASG